VLADEPTGNLDRASGADVMKMLVALNARGQTIVIVTHDAAVASHAQRVLFMRDGSLVDEVRVDAAGDASAVAARMTALEV